MNVTVALSLLLAISLIVVAWSLASLARTRSRGATANAGRSAADTAVVAAIVAASTAASAGAADCSSASNCS